MEEVTAELLAELKNLHDFTTDYVYSHLECQLACDAFLARGELAPNIDRFNRQIKTLRTAIFRLPNNYTHALDIIPASRPTIATLVIESHGPVHCACNHDIAIAVMASSYLANLPSTCSTIDDHTRFASILQEKLWKFDCLQFLAHLQHEYRTAREYLLTRRQSLLAPPNQLLGGAANAPLELLAECGGTRRIDPPTGPSNSFASDMYLVQPSLTSMITLVPSTDRRAYTPGNEAAAGRGPNLPFPKLASEPIQPENVLPPNDGRKRRGRKPDSPTKRQHQIDAVHDAQSRHVKRYGYDGSPAELSERWFELMSKWNEKPSPPSEDWIRARLKLAPTNATKRKQFRS